MKLYLQYFKIFQFNSKFEYINIESIKLELLAQNQLARDQEIQKVYINYKLVLGDYNND